jgi:hypothetical protein
LERKHTFGGQGDGVDQFQYWPQLGLHGETVYGVDYLKTSLFSMQGDLLGTIPYTVFGDFDPGMEMVLLPAGDRFVRVTVDHNASRRYVGLYDDSYELVGSLYEGLFDWQGALPPYRVDVTCDGKHIVISDSERGFFIRIFDTQGSLLRTIDKSTEVTSVAFTDADRLAYLESVRLNEPRLYEEISQNARFKKDYPIINHVDIDSGKLYVTTERRRDDKHELVILNLEGRILKTLFVPLKSMNRARRILRFDPYVVHRGELYEIARNDSSGVYELLVTKLE